MDRTMAEALALQALGWLAREPERAGAFLDAAGCAPEDLRARIAEPAFLGFVLDHVLAEDESVIAFAGEVDAPPERVRLARASLPGGDAPEWT
ncbi:MAG: DUF3572 domain-containing protein [Paracoccaceae bacterium]